MALEEDHDRLHGALRGPAFADLGRALLPDTGHLLKSVGLFVNHAEGLHAEGQNQAFGVGGPDAFDEPRGQVLFDTVDGGRYDRLEFLHLQLGTEFLVVNPASGEPDGLAFGHSEEIAHKGDQIGIARRLQARHHEARVRTFKHDALHDPFQQNRRSEIALGGLGALVGMHDALGRIMNSKLEIVN